MNTKKPEKGQKMKVQELIDRIIAKCGVEPLDRTCDQVIEGDPQAEITGIVTTFMATVDVIREAYRVGANLIITHEPTYLPGMMRETGWHRIQSILKKDSCCCNAEFAYGVFMTICIWRQRGMVSTADCCGSWAGRITGLPKCGERIAIF